MTRDRVCASACPDWMSSGISGSFTAGRPDPVPTGRRWQAYPQRLPLSATEPRCGPDKAAPRQSVFWSGRGDLQLLLSSEQLTLITSPSLLIHALARVRPAMPQAALWRGRSLFVLETPGPASGHTNQALPHALARRRRTERTTVPEEGQKDILDAASKDDSLRG